MKKIEVLGVGCPNCKKTEALIRQVTDKLGWQDGADFELTKVTSPNDIASYGILATPGVVIDGKVVHSGKVPSKGMIERWLA
ncbi:thioredoxin family protein [bacterium]|nr:thioredoxin family protein [bacterium]